MNGKPKSEKESKSFKNSCMALYGKKPVFNMDHVVYGCYQKEICPSTGKEHWQCYVEFKKSYDIQRCKNYIGYSHKGRKSGNPDEKDCVLIKRQATDPQDAINYCMKPESAVPGTFEEFGDRTCINDWGKKKKGNQGKREDLRELGRQVLAGVDDLDIDPMYWIKYSRGIEKLQSLMINQRRLTEYTHTDVVVVYGDAGVGKTRTIYELEGINNCYKLERTGNDRLFFNGYKGEKVLILDDFYGWIKWGQLLNILDGYPQIIEVKNSYAHRAWNKVYITSNKPYEEWYPRVPNIDALTRRIKYVTKWERKPDDPPMRVPLHITVDELKLLNKKNVESDIPYVPQTRAPSFDITAMDNADQNFENDDLQ